MCETIHTIRYIKFGEEITISYDRGGLFDFRRTYLKEAFGFGYDCSLYSFSSLNRQVSDARCLQIKFLDDAIGDPNRVINKPNKCLADCHCLLQVLDEKYKGSAGALIAKVYYDAFQISITHGDQARASVFAERGHQSRVICEGMDSSGTQRIKNQESDGEPRGAYKFRSF